jgi:FMN phosphatase YigB (HAD superfamily)
MEYIKAVGFDLAGTLYEDSPAMMAKVQDEIAARVLDKRPGLKDIDGAKAFLKRRLRRCNIQLMFLEISVIRILLVL